MITEDYVSFEVAKLLKEKGFEGYSILTIYDENAANVYIKELQEKYLPYSSDDSKLKEFYYTQPTLQMAMKWLREVHNLYIEISLSCDREDKNAKIFDASIFNVQNQRYKKLSNIQGYESACEAAIKYSLENLI